jgi:lanthanide-dependent methanol dehydrogenase
LGRDLYKFKTPSGIIGNVTTYEPKGKQYVAVLSGIGG